MESFSEEVKASCGDRDEPAKIEEALELLNALKVDSSDGLALSPVSKLPSKLFDLVQFGVRRGIELGEAAVREINRLNVSSSCTLVRGVLETACLLYDTMRNVEAAVEKGDANAADDLDKWLTNALLGHGPKAKTFILAEEYVVQNILTIIQRLDKELEAPFGGFYEGLSEHAHPNYHGMMALYFDGHDGAISKFTDHREGRTKASVILAICALAMSLDVLALVAEKRAELSDELATLSEKKIHKRGSWPADVKYPIRCANPESVSIGYDPRRRPAWNAHVTLQLMPSGAHRPQGSRSDCAANCAAIASTNGRSGHRRTGLRSAGFGPEIANLGAIREGPLVPSSV